MFPGEEGWPKFVTHFDLEQEAKDLIDGSLAYISCWLRGLEYNSCKRRCTARKAQVRTEKGKVGGTWGGVAGCCGCVLLLSLS